MDDTKNFYFHEFLDKYTGSVSDPNLCNPQVWLWITESVDWHCQALVYANKIKHEYIHKALDYMPSNNEHLKGIPKDKAVKKHVVLLLILIKKGSIA